MQTFQVQVQIIRTLYPSHPVNFVVLKFVHILKKIMDVKRKCLYVEGLHIIEIRETKRGRQNLQVFLSHILTPKTGLSYSRTNGLRFPPPLCVSESKTACKFWIYGLRIPTVLSSTVAETASQNPRWMEKIVLCRVGEKDGSWWEEGRLSFSILRWMILTGVCVSRG